MAAGPPPFALALDLQTQEEREAFIELYGYWLGHGSLHGSRQLITLGVHQGAQAAYLDTLFHRLARVLPKLPSACLKSNMHGYRALDREESDEVVADGDDRDEDFDGHGDEQAGDDDDNEDDGSDVDHGDGDGDGDMVIDCVAGQTTSPHAFTSRARCRVVRRYRIQHPTWWQYFAQQYGCTVPLSHPPGDVAPPANTSQWRRGMDRL